ncbi:hypothetical protein PPACK8108_LOCUS9953 [Phakopsora pachyrhizi]|uniref:Secreted protein n=1 Tax=Phakopsora pachyrhizi TaxID=170000 RepID=A0AAV0AZB6_PHAPC|nr:hypothetical protein PPACK8108_LOCUS9953 [Phakopsora pachyrhizi]
MKRLLIILMKLTWAFIGLLGLGCLQSRGPKIISGFLYFRYTPNLTKQSQSDFRGLFDELQNRSSGLLYIYTYCCCCQFLLFALLPT